MVNPIHLGENLSNSLYKIQEVNHKVNLIFIRRFLLVNHALIFLPYATIS